MAENEEDHVEIKTEPQIEEIVNTNQGTGPLFLSKPGYETGIEIPGESAVQIEILIIFFPELIAKDFYGQISISYPVSIYDF